MSSGKFQLHLEDVKRIGDFKRLWNDLHERSVYVPRMILPVAEITIDGSSARGQSNANPSRLIASTVRKLEHGENPHVMRCTNVRFIALPEAKVDQYQSVDLMYQALNSGRSDAAATDQSSLAWFMLQSPGRYQDAGFGWNPQSYACAVKRGDQEWLNFVDSVLHEAMTGVEFATYAASFKKWFGVDLKPPRIGFPVEYK